MRFMNVPLLTWICMAAVVIVLLAAHVIHLRHSSRHSRHRMFGIGSEREEFFIPGDPLRRTDKDYDCDDDDF